MSEEERSLQHQDFISAILDQLYLNRRNHENSHKRDIPYMVYIVNEQLGQLTKAIADDDFEKAEVEVSHVTAVLYEVYERILAKKNDN